MAAVTQKGVEGFAIAASSEAWTPGQLLMS